MALNFPNSPSDGEKYTDPVNQVEYTYSSTVDSWTGALAIAPPESVAPTSTDISHNPSISSGTGTSADPYVLTAATATNPGDSLESTEELTISSGRPGDMVAFTNNSTGDSTGRFVQDTYKINSDGQVKVKLKYLDTPNTSVNGSVYTGLLNIGTVHYKWVVTQQVVTALVKAAETTIADDNGGEVEAGDTLTCTQGSVTGGTTPITYTTQWESAPVGGTEYTEIPGATQETYATTTDDANRTIRATVTATDNSATAQTMTLTSEAVGPVVYKVAPEISSVTLTDNSASASRFTDETFTSAVAFDEPGAPSSSLAVKALLEGALDYRPLTSAITTYTATSGSITPDTIAGSRRMDSADIQYLFGPNVTPTADITDWTFAAWIKRSKTGKEHPIWASIPLYGDNTAIIYIGEDDLLYVPHADGTSKPVEYEFDDTNAWYHICVANASTGVKVYVDGRQVPVLEDHAPYSIVAETLSVGIGKHPFSPKYFDGCIAQPIFLDGQAKDPLHVFGDFNVAGHFFPKLYSSNYTLGATGFLIDTADPTTSGFNSVRSTADLDSPSIGLATLNPRNSMLPIAGAGLSVSYNNSSTTAMVAASLAIPKGSYKYYWEVTIDELEEAGTHGVTVGVIDRDLPVKSGSQFSNMGAFGYDSSTGNKVHTGGSLEYGETFTKGDVIGVLYNGSNGTITFTKNSISQGSAFSGVNEAFIPAVSIVGKATVTFNFGGTAFGNSQIAGYSKLGNASLPASAVTNAPHNMDVLLHSGSSIRDEAQSFAPSDLNGLLWIKDHSATDDHILIDVVRGSSSVLASNNDAAATTYSAPANESVSWSWKAAATSATNTDGGTEGTVAANTTAGFSIVKFNLPGTDSNVGHGLGAAPDLVIYKPINNTGKWSVYAKGIDGYGQLNEALGFSSTTSGYFSGVPTSTVIPVSGNLGTTGDHMIAYCWETIEGYSKIGTYTGQGGSDNNFIHTGFKPHWVMIKPKGTGSWRIYDTKRNPFNPVSHASYSNSDALGSKSNEGSINIFSNGFNLGGYATSTNKNGETYLYMAFAKDYKGGAVAANSYDTLVFTDDTDLSYLTEGNELSAVTAPLTQGRVARVDVSGKSVDFYPESGSDWTGAKNSSLQVIATQKIIANTTAYGIMDSAGNIERLDEADPGYVEMSAPDDEITIKFPHNLASGYAPDTEIISGTTLTTSVRAMNDSGTDYSKSNTLTP